MNHMRNDERLKVVMPGSWVLPCRTPGPQALDPAFTPMYDGETEIWFDWAALGGSLGFCGLLEGEQS
jgi:hypothetical protein